MGKIKYEKRPMPKNFDFAEAEKRLYEWWDSQGWFRPECADENAETFVISMPPPNVTGSLHVGHALCTAIEDLMTRYERMRGKAALWLPGTDHAGIATQLQVEKSLNEEGLTRFDIGREAFLERTWRWKEEKGGTIIKQLRRLGASCDWTRERFTLDEGLSEAVQEVFVRLWEQGLIYRGPRLVNWSPGLRTAVSDLEVERAEEKSTLYYFNYPVEGGDSIPVATTRPETILGDTAVCVHPEDPRYQHLIGKKAYVPMLNREIPIIADDYVDLEFGTGALKITPAHDFNDYDIAMRHGLEVINILNKDATINDDGGQYAGLDRFVCRQQLWADMEAAGLTIKTEAHQMTVPRSQRGGEIIEPLLSDQWFVKMDAIAQKALDAVRNGDIKIVPERFEKVYYHWLENIQDWCVSRQLWWGHRIPAWYREKDGDPYGEIYVGRTAPEGDGWREEEDVLDTWFSSGLWPFSTLGWPDDTPDLRRYYPTDIMETGHDILFFWVARMIMMGLWFTDKPPFHTVYLHGLVRDKDGRKFSKTIGNVIDPLVMIEQYGADPLRFALVTSGTPGNDVNLDMEWVENSWNFINKVWQATSFTVGNLDDDTFELGAPAHDALDLPARWVMSRLNRLIKNVQYLFDTYQYGEAGRNIRGFLWDEFAPWYLEISKHALYNGTPEERNLARRVLVHVLDTCLRLLHPFMPFATEEMWQHLPHDGETLMLAKWPQVDATYIDADAESQMEILMGLVRGVRDIRNNQYKIDPAKKLSAVIAPGSHRDNIARYHYIFGRLCNVHEINILDNDAAPDKSASTIVSDATLYIPIADMVDFEVECARLTKEQESITAQINKTQGMLNNDKFVDKAPPDVVQRERDRLRDLQASAARVAERLAELCQ
ncbi:MAG: valine--tRNA ligase [Anaerolineaceae bacterium]|nr:MAG: valine--tRNA ligase [Anaerolineaceae bacterium]